MVGTSGAVSTNICGAMGGISFTSLEKTPADGRAFDYRTPSYGLPSILKDSSRAFVPRKSVMPGRVVLAMSGGVDSSVAAYLLKKQGYDVVGLFMRTGVHQPEDTACDTNLPPSSRAEGEGSARDRKKGCCSAIDAGDARRVADRLDIPFYALDFEGDFTRIMDYFVDEYTQGRTPNPC